MQVIYGGTEAFNALAYGEQNPDNLAYFRERLDGLACTFSDAGQAFANRARELHDQYYNSNVAHIARAALRASQNLFMPNSVMMYQNIGQLQQAGTTMQRWIMANPIVRQAYHAQQCDGYSNSYVDMHPGKIGEDHYDYRRVMDGVVQESDEHDWVAKFYMDDTLEGDVDLSHNQKVDILSTWDIANLMMAKAGEDPTSPWNGKL
jgi:hypothetical protein